MLRRTLLLHSLLLFLLSSTLIFPTFSAPIYYRDNQSSQVNANTFSWNLEGVDKSSTPLASPYPITNYSTVVLLETDIHVIVGQTTVNYVNHANVSLDEVVFHLYPNAFSPEGSTTITEVTHQGAILSYTITGVDNTILTVDLVNGSGPGSLTPNQNVTIDMLFRVNVPERYDRFGWAQTNSPVSLLAYNLGNWHPIVAVYDDRGWDRAPYTYMGESFYSDVAIWDVYVNVPASYIVAATGELEEITSNNGLRTWHWVTGPVRDFTMCISPDYLTSSIMVGGINVTSYHALGHEEGGNRVLEVAEQCLNVYGDLFGSYPYSSLRIVDTDFWAGGMEYPQLIMIDTSLYENPSGLSYLAIVVAHEIGHEWVPFSIGTDSYTEPWIDEGFASFCEYVFVEYIFGEAERKDYRLYDYENYWDYVEGAGDKSINQSMDYWESLGGYDYVRNVYTKAALVYDMLRHQLGNETFYAAWQYIYGQALHQNIRAIDLQRLFEEAVNAPLDWFFDQWVFGSGIVTLNLGSANAQQVTNGWSITFELHQAQLSPIALYVPVQVYMISGSQLVWVWMAALSVTYHTIVVSDIPVTILLDPEHNLLCQYEFDVASVIISPTPSFYQQLLSGIAIVVLICLLVGVVYFLWIRRRSQKQA